MTLKESLFFQLAVTGLVLGYCYFHFVYNADPSYVPLEDLKLTYFPLQGRGEPIRLYLKYLEIEFEDIRVTGDEWQELKTSEEGKKKFTFGQLPHLQNGDFNIVQMNAILAHIDRQARKIHRMTTGEEFLVQQEQIAWAIEDFRGRFGRLSYGSSDGKDEYLEQLPKYLGYFENILMDNGGFYGGGNYLVGDEASYIDISLWDLLEKHQSEKLAPDCLDEFPMVCLFLIYDYFSYLFSFFFS